MLHCGEQKMVAPDPKPDLECKQSSTTSVAKTLQFPVLGALATEFAAMKQLQGKLQEQLQSKVPSEALQHQIKSRDDQIKSRDDQIKSRDDEIHRLQKMLRETQRRNVAAATAINDLTVIIEAKTKQNQTLHDEVGRTQTSLIERQNELETVSTTNNTVQTRLAQASRQLTLCNEQLAAGNQKARQQEEQYILSESKLKGLEEQLAAAKKACAGLTTRLLSAHSKHGKEVQKMKENHIRKLESLREEHQTSLLDAVAEATTAASESLNTKHDEQHAVMKNTNIVLSAFFCKLFELATRAGLLDEETDLPKTLCVLRDEIGVFDRQIVTKVFGALKSLLEDVDRLQRFTGSSQWLAVRQQTNPVLVRECTATKIGFKTSAVNNTVQCLFGLITMFSKYRQATYVLSGSFKPFFKYYHPLKYEEHYREGSTQFSNQFSMTDIVGHMQADTHFLNDLAQCPQQLCSAARYSSMSFNPVHARISTIMLSTLMQQLQNRIASMFDDGTLPDDLRPAVAASAIECLSFYNTQFDDAALEKLYVLAGSDALRFKELVLCSVVDQDNAAVLDRLWIDEQTSVMAHLFSATTVNGLLQMKHTRTIRAAFVEMNCKWYFQQPTIDFMQLYADKRRRKANGELREQSKKNRGELDEAYQRVLDLMQLVEGADDKEGESVHAEAFAEP